MINTTNAEIQKKEFNESKKTLVEENYRKVMILTSLNPGKKANIESAGGNKRDFAQ